MAHDGVFTDDPSEAVEALEQQIFGKKLMGRAGLEIRPVANRGMGTGLMRAAAAHSTDVTSIWRAYVLKPRGRVAFVPPKNMTPEGAGARLAEVGVIGPDGQVMRESYEYHFDPDTTTDHLVRFALSSLSALGYKPPGVMWNWLARAKDQVPR
jgi:hypothetical protein